MLKRFFTLYSSYLRCLTVVDELALLGIIVGAVLAIYAILTGMISVVVGIVTLTVLAGLSAYLTLDVLRKVHAPRE